MSSTADARRHSADNDTVVTLMQELAAKLDAEAKAGEGKPEAQIPDLNHIVPDLNQ